MKPSATTDLHDLDEAYELMHLLGDLSGSVIDVQPVSPFAALQQKLISISPQRGP